MGANSSTRTDPNSLSDDDVNFDHFQILRAIGKGSFGKVCIVQKRDTGRLFAMKYVSRNACESRGALGGVLKEVELLASLEHPFLVNLWFSFQDEEDLFMVCDLLTGGDLRYHLQQRVEFSEDSVALLVCELGSALDYLQTQRVVHRDIKPDNILLDEEGHAHLTDFNIATRLQKDGLACSMSGTKPYMAPEVFMCALDEIAGYSFPVDWWSLGVVAYEMRAGTRPFIIHSNTPLTDVKNTLNTPIHYPRYWSNDFVDLLTKLLTVLPGARLSSQRELNQTPMLRSIDFRTVVKKKILPPYRPPQDHLNCDPCLELEEMIVETKPLHKKKKRLAKQRSAQRDNCDPESNLIKEFIIYNRYKELKRKAMERKENEWQKELDLAMANSVVNCLIPIRSGDKIVAGSSHHASGGDNGVNVNNGDKILSGIGSDGNDCVKIDSAISDTCVNSDIINSRKNHDKIKNSNEINQRSVAATTTTTTKNEDEPIEYIDRTPSPRSLHA